VKGEDPTRLVNEASGWNNRGGGDVRDVHIRVAPSLPPPDSVRAAVLGDFGGLGLEVTDHLWLNRRSWAGGLVQASAEDLQHYYEVQMQQLASLQEKGLCAAVYNQATDVELEVDGLVTYDRKVFKLDTDRLQAAHACFYDPSKVMPAAAELIRWASDKVTTISPTSEKEGQIWRYTMDTPSEGWVEHEFDDTDWKTGPGMFGVDHTPSIRRETTWNSREIYLRKTFTIEKIPKLLGLRILHDDAAEVYINGKQVKAFSRWAREFADIPLTGKPDFLKVGENTIAVHCHQDGGGQAIDVGILAIMD
jgi:hypothetical protein